MLVLISGSMQAQTGSMSIDELFIENQTSGASMFVRVHQSNISEKAPAIVMIPGGRGAGSTSLRTPVIADLVDLGTMVVIFDPDGRGRSSGVEDDNGFAHQDGLKAIIEYAASHPNSDGRVILLSYSYGVTMATGVLSRYPNLPVVLYIDWEGPANRDDTGGCGAERIGHLQDAGCNNEPFWAEREASTFIKTIQVPYQRVQSQRDHVQPDNNHAVLLINNATHIDNGGEGQSPWTRLNTQSSNAIYPYDQQLGWLPENIRQDNAILDYVESFLDGSLIAGQ
jgi:hypothetical protein